MKDSKIEWTDHTFNAWSGCTKVSEACAHCYAEALSKRSATLGGWGPGAPRRRTSESYWRQPLRWNAAADWSAVGRAFSGMANKPAARPRVFCNSLADWLDDDGVPIEWLADLLLLIGQTPNLDWLLLTKRPENWKGRVWDAAKVLCERGQDYGWVESWLAAADSPMAGEAPHNVWLGTTVENQKRADERIPKLLGIPAVVRFLSCEPLLGPVDLARIRCVHAPCSRDVLTGWTYWPDGDEDVNPSKRIHWVICGGESGPGARPMQAKWARLLRDQCHGAGVAFFFKQWGQHDCHGQRVTAKADAGRLLDGVDWQQFPEVAAR